MSLRQKNSKAHVLLDPYQKILSLTPAQLKKLSRKDVPEESFFLSLSAQPIKSYRKLEQNPLSATESLPFALKVLADLNERLDLGSVLELPSFKSFRQNLLQLRQEGIALVKNNMPLPAFYTFVLRYVESMDQLFRKTDLSLSGTYHRDFAQGCLQSLLKCQKGTRIFFTGKAVDDLYLLHIRPTAIYLNWVIELPPFSVNAKNYQGGPLVPASKIQRFIDGLRLDLEEIMKHDLGHSFLMQRQDQWLFASAGFSRLTLIKEWTKNKNHIFFHWEILSKADPNLAKAVRILLFELIHDRGYQFYLPILRQQLNASKWAEIIRLKQKNGYYGENSFSQATEQRLDEARLWLLHLVEKRLRDDNLQKIETLEGKTFPLIIKHWKNVESYKGYPFAIELNDLQDFKVYFEVPAFGIKSTSLYLISLVLAPSSKVPILTPDKVAKIEKWIWHKKHCAQIETLRLNAEGDIEVQWKTKVALNFAEERLSQEDRLSQIELYKLERLLFLIKNKQSTPFTITHSPESFKGKIIQIDSVNDSLQFIDEQGEKHAYLLKEISLQPATNRPFTTISTISPPAHSIEKSGKYINLNAEDRFVDAALLRESYLRCTEYPDSSTPFCAN